MNIRHEILETIKTYQRIIIHRHMRPDPDAIGSQAGLAEILRASFPEKEIYQVGSTVADLEFLAKMDDIPDDFYQDALVIVTDTANAPRVSDLRYDRGSKLIKIDHHPNDEPYGDIVWVNTKASSCSEMIADFAFSFPDELKVNSAAARLLYAGIVGDTGRFLYPATTSYTLNIAGRLIDYDFDAAELNRQLQQITMEVARLSGYLYENIEVDEYGAARVVLTKEILASFGVDDSETAGLVPLPGMIDTVLAWGIFVQQPEGYYRVRLRSKGPVINEIAKQHHGGGHPLASGANAATLAEAEEIYQQIQEVCRIFTEQTKEK